MPDKVGIHKRDDGHIQLRSGPLMGNENLQNGLAAIANDRAVIVGLERSDTVKIT